MEVILMTFFLEMYFCIFFCDSKSFSRADVHCCCIKNCLIQTSLNEAIKQLFVVQFVAKNTTMCSLPGRKMVYQSDRVIVFLENAHELMSRKRCQESKDGT